MLWWNGSFCIGLRQGRRILWVTFLSWLPSGRLLLPLDLPISLCWRFPWLAPRTVLPILNLDHILYLNPSILVIHFSFASCYLHQTYFVCFFEKCGRWHFSCWIPLTRSKSLLNIFSLFWMGASGYVHHRRSKDYFQPFRQFIFEILYSNPVVNPQPTTCAILKLSLILPLPSSIVIIVDFYSNHCFHLLRYHFPIIPMGWNSKSSK